MDRLLLCSRQKSGSGCGIECDKTCSQLEVIGSMRAWATGIVCLYVCLVLFDWVTGLHWLADFSLPMAIVGGVGLAIASHPNQISDTATSHTLENTAATPEVEPAQPAQAVEQPAATPESSISFTINKSVRPG